MSVRVDTRPIGPVREKLNLLENELTHLQKRANTAAKRSFKKIEVSFAECRVTLASLRLTLKALKSYTPSMGPHLSKPIGVIGFINLPTLVLTPKYALDGVKEAWISFRLGDIEGIFFNSIGSLQSLSDGLDALMTLSYSLHDIDPSIAIPEIFQKMFVPLALASTAVDITLRGIKLYKTRQLLKEVDSFSAGNPFIDELKTKLNKKPSTSPELSKRRILRHGSEAIYKAIHSGNKTVAKDLLSRKIAMDISIEVTNVVAFIAISLFLVPNLPLHVAFASLTVVTAAKVALLVYEKNFLYADLKEKNKEIFSKS